MIELDLETIDAIAVAAGPDLLPVCASVPLRRKDWDWH